MTKSLSVTLYYADWCGHCVNFKPEWEKIGENIKKLKNKYKDINIILEKYSDKDLEKINGGTINNERIQGFPTIKFTLEVNGKKKEYDYSDYGKKRNYNYMFKFINNVCKGLHKYTK